VDNVELIETLPGNISRVETDESGCTWLVLESVDRVLIGGALYDALVDMSVWRGGNTCYRVSPIDTQVGNLSKQIDMDQIDGYNRRDIVLKITGFVKK
jgi:hypothetical protein